MRKDVQFGLTIGGSLLAILVVYLTLFYHGAQKKNQDVSLVPGSAGPAAAQSDAKAGALDVTQTGATAPAADSHSAGSVAIGKADGAATQPSSTADSSSTGRDWTQLLASGGSATQPSLMSASGSSVATIVPLPEGAAATGAAATGAATTGAATTGAATTGAAATARTHKVAAGETFSTISAAVYGDSKYFGQIEDANPDVKPNRLRIGMIINVPELNSPVAVKASVVEAPTPALAELDATKSYRVRSADTLMAIARKLYGNGQVWEKIYDANRDAIGPNPARLKVDMVLRLPDPPTVAIAN